MLSVIPPVDTDHSSDAEKLGDTNTLFLESILYFMFSLDKYLIGSITFIFFLVVEKSLLE
jgi:hypothetical protein